MIDKDPPPVSHGMVAAKHPLAARAGIETLESGGNAVDAAVATALACGVVEPWNGGLGGGGFLVSSSADTGETTIYDFNVVSPLEAHPLMFELEQGDGPEEFPWRAVVARRNAIGFQAVAVPGTPAGLSLALEREGTIDLATAAAPAIELADRGFAIDWYAAIMIGNECERLACSRATASIFLPEGHPVRIGGVVRQPDLAETLRTLARDGVQVFYTGSIADAIAQGVQSQGGVLDGDDLARYAPRVRGAGATVSFAGVDLVGPGAPGGAPTVVQILAALDPTELEAAGHNSVPALDLLARSAGAAFRERYTELEPGLRSGAGSTTHICVIDRQRNVVSLTQTLCSTFGSGAMVPSTGIILNNGMLWFDPVPGKATSIRGDTRPLVNMAPVVALRNGRPLGAIGATGGRRVISAVTQVVINMLAHGMRPQPAISAPRIDMSGDAIYADERLPRQVVDGLRLRGYDVVRRESAFHPDEFGCPLALSLCADDRLIFGGSHPYHPAVCLGY